MKNVLQRTLTTLALIVAMMTAAATVKAQQVNMSKYITLDVQSGQQIKLNFKAAAPNTPVRIVSGSNTQDITVGTSWYDGNTPGPSNFTVTSDGTTMTVYGNITGFDCFYNQDRLAAIDVSNNTELKELICSGNSISSLDVSKNTKLEKLKCSFNKFSSIDVSKNTELKLLECTDSNLTSIDLSKNTELEDLELYYNKLSSLEVSNNRKLKFLRCDANRLTSLDVSKNTELVKLVCRYNKLISLDVSKNTELGRLDCSNNNLSSLDVSNNPKLEDLYCYHNSFSTVALDRLYCSLPDNKGSSINAAIYPAYNYYDPQHDVVLASSGKIATDKNWYVLYGGLSSLSIHTTGTRTCGQLPTLVRYGIRVAGTELSSDNKDAIDNANFPRLSISRGSITFDHATKTLTLRNLKAEVNEATFLDFISLEGGYKIHLVGSNEIQVSGNGYSGIELYNNLTITGSSESSLKIESQIPVFVDIQSTLTIKNATVELFSSGNYGITGRYGDDGEKLIIDNSTVKAFGAKGSIAYLEDITLKSCHIAAPAGAAIATNGSKGKAVMKNGQVVKEQVVIQPDGTGIDNPLAAALTLYPNPVESILHIEAEGEVRSIRIYNTYGTEVATATKQIDLSHLPAGVYALRVETERGVATQRVVKK